jgi:pilus assembly protein Flp/PilA
MLMFAKAQNWLMSLRDREDGQALVEYALILALIAVVCIGALQVLGTNVEAKLQEIATAVANAGT